MRGNGFSRLILTGSLFTVGTVEFLASPVPVRAGSIYVDDNLAIYAFSTNGSQSTFSNQVGQTALEMAFNSSGTLFAANRDSNNILAYSPSGVRSIFASISSPYGLAVDSSGDVFSGGNFGGTLMKYTPAGVGSVFATGISATELAEGPNGNLYENDNDGHIYEFAPDGTKSVFASGLNAAGFGNSSIYGLTFDSGCNLYASNWQGQILTFDPSGNQSIFATYDPTSTLITGLAYDNATGNLYGVEVANGISNCCTQQLWAFSSSGVRTTVASDLNDPWGSRTFRQGGHRRRNLPALS